MQGNAIQDYEKHESKPIAVVLLSGGMDSCVCAAIAKDLNYELALLHSSYGQRPERTERECFDKITAYYKPEAVMCVDQSYIAKIGGSALTDASVPIPLLSHAEIHTRKIPRYVCPFQKRPFLVRRC